MSKSTIAILQNGFYLRMHSNMNLILRTNTFRLPELTRMTVKNNLADPDLIETVEKNELKKLVIFSVKYVK